MVPGEDKDSQTLLSYCALGIVLSAMEAIFSLNPQSYPLSR